MNTSLQNTNQSIHHSKTPTNQYITPKHQPINTSLQNDGRDTKPVVVIIREILSTKKKRKKKVTLQDDLS